MCPDGASKPQAYDLAFLDGDIYAVGAMSSLFAFDPDTLTYRETDVDGLPRGAHGAVWITAGEVMYSFHNRTGDVFEIRDFLSPNPVAVHVGAMSPSNSNDGSGCVEAPSPFTDPEGYAESDPSNPQAAVVHIVRNTGRSPLRDVSVVDDFGTPDDTDDDRSAVGRPDGGDDGDGVLEPGEAWRYVFVEPVVGRIEAGAAAVVAGPTGGVVVMDDDGLVGVDAGTSVEADGPVPPEEPAEDESSLPGGVVAAAGLLTAAAAAAALAGGSGGAASAGGASAAAAKIG